jgi:hypothetical protein
VSLNASALPADARLEDVVLAALADARSRGPGRWPTCLVCSGSMRVDEVERGRLELTCDTCGSSLTESTEPMIELRLVS